MSRTGKQPILVPDKVKVSLNSNLFMAEGPLGKETVEVNLLAKVAIDDNKIVVTRVNNTQHARCVHGMTRALLANAVKGVHKGFQKDLEINGIGYRAESKGKTLKLTLGFSHAIDFPVPEGIKVETPEPSKITVKGANKELVGRFTSQVRELRPPEPYKGKGIKYAGEHIIRKVGKAAGGK
ncbi:MAG: 50S ribosomal protein L6 [uncultured bacterium]|nr:MAG: 50S ribosomal protein L6 [uncultured bacterium]HLD45225.1 50S ribosomal protein L6 [bacterium]